MNTIRIFWPAGTVPDKGGFLNPKFSSEPGFRVVWPPITSSSIVLISPCEYRPDDVPRFTPVLQRFVGDAVISVNGIAPSDGEKPGDSGYVDFDIEARHHDGSPWGDPLDIMVDIVVLDPPELMVNAESGEVLRVDTRPQSQKKKDQTAQGFTPRQQATVRKLLAAQAGPLSNVKVTGRPRRKKALKRP